VLASGKILQVTVSRKEGAASR